MAENNLVSGRFQDLVSSRYLRILLAQNSSCIFTYMYVCMCVGPRPPSIQREVERLRRLEIGQLKLTVDDLRCELAEAREELQKEKERTESAMEREKYWETEFQNQIKEIQTGEFFQHYGFVFQSHSIGRNCF